MQHSVPQERPTCHDKLHPLQEAARAVRRDRIAGKNLGRPRGGAAMPAQPPRLSRERLYLWIRHESGHWVLLLRSLRAVGSGACTDAAAAWRHRLPAAGLVR